jgi:hypothetical protein
MSIRAMTDAAVSRQLAVGSPTSARALREAPAPSAPGSAGGDDVVGQLTRYIPTELVAVYTAVVGLLPNLESKPEVCQAHFGVRWWTLAVFAILTPITVQILYLIKRRSAGAGGPTVPWFELISGLVAFAAWAILLPLAPVYTWCSWQPQYGLIIGLIVLFVVGLLGRLIAAVPPSTPAAGK